VKTRGQKGAVFLLNLQGKDISISREETAQRKRLGGGEEFQGGHFQKGKTLEKGNAKGESSKRWLKEGRLL